MRFRKNRAVAIALAFALSIAFVLTLSTSAYADSAEPEAQETIAIKEVPTKAVVVDSRGIFSKDQIKQIEDAGEKLTVYDIGLYVEMTDRSVCSQSYTNKLSEEKYATIMNSKENSIIIVFSFYENAEGYYAVHYNVQGDLSESKISSIIEGTYHDYKTDSEWIVGSFIQVVDYLTGVEYNLIHAEEIAIAKKAQREENLKTFLFVGRILLEIAAVATIITLIIAHRKKDSLYEEEISNLSRNKESLERKLQTANENLARVNEERSNLLTWQSNARSVDTEIDSKIEDDLAQREAAFFDRKYGKAFALDQLDEMLNRYEEMTALEQSYVKTDISSAQARHDELAKEEAEKATQILKDAYTQYPGDRYHLDQLNSTIEYYEGLPLCVRMLIAMTIINNLRSSRKAAESDHQRHQSYNSYHNDSYRSTPTHTTFHSGTFGGGFGGGH